VLKYLRCGQDCKIWLAKMTGAAGYSLCVVKQTEDMAAAAKEGSNKLLLRGVGVHCIRPPSITGAVRRHSGTNGRQCWFLFDPQRWLLRDKVTPGAIPERLNTVATTLRELATATGFLNAEIAALSAIARMADLGLHHWDLKWHHLALVPQFDGGGNVLGFCAGVIVLESVEVGVQPRAACALMLTKLTRMIKGKTFHM
jgi:hypothetical protein